MTNWYVITGGPSSGKTTTANLLGALGYKTTIEHARHYIDTQRVIGRTVEEIRANQLEFQRGVTAMQIAHERALDPDEMCFLDRALPDALAYYRFLDLAPDETLLQAMQSASYRKVFLLDLLPLAKDYARTEDEAAQKCIHALLGDACRELGFAACRITMRPVPSTGKYVTRASSRSRKWQGSMIAGCSIRVVTMWSPLALSVKKAPLSARLFASLPPLVKTTSSLRQPSKAAT